MTEADVTAADFYAAATETGANWLTLSTSTSVRLMWLDATGAGSKDGTCSSIRVKPGSNTGTRAGDGRSFELRAKLSDGSNLTLLQEALIVVPGQVDRP